MSDLMKIGADWGGTGTFKPFTASLSGAQRVTDAHPRFLDAAAAGRLYTYGVSNTALVAANAIATGVTATAQPVIGVLNPSGSGVILVPLMIVINTTTVANTAVAPGGFMWVAASPAAVTTGTQPYNAKTFLQSGSAAKAFSISTALTGLIGSLSTIRSTLIGSINAAGPATAIHQPTTPSFEVLDGDFVVYPNSFLGVMNQVSTTTISVSTGIVWEEIPYLV